VWNTGEIFKSIENINEIPKNVNSFTPIYPDAGIEIENNEFPEKYEVSAERAGRKLKTDIKNSFRP
jgi:hypothetical protein